MCMKSIFLPIRSVLGYTDPKKTMKKAVVSLIEWLVQLATKKSDAIICFRLWGGTYTQQCWIQMWICCDILIAVLRLFCVWNQRDCETRACQKRTFEMPIGRMPTSIVMQQVVMQDLWTIWFKPCLWWIVNMCSYLSVCVVWSNSTALHVYLQQQIITNRLSTFSDHDLFIIFVFVVQYLYTMYNFKIVHINWCPLYACWNPSLRFLIMLQLFKYTCFVD